ncbi:hypothetical protein ACRAWG_12930 [Methylobacterium sp. P31]
MSAEQKSALQRSEICKQQRNIIERDILFHCNIKSIQDKKLRTRSDEQTGTEKIQPIGNPADGTSAKPVIASIHHNWPNS